MTNPLKQNNNKHHGSITLWHSNNQAVLLIHGLTSTPKAVERIAEHINKSGFNVSVPLLPGHGTTPDDLLNVQWQDWFHTIEGEFLRLRNLYDRIFIVGVSLGGNIGLCLNAKYPQDIKKIVSIGTPIFLRKQFYIKSVLPVYSLFNKFHKKKISNEQIGYYSQTGTYTVWPYHSLKQLFAIIDETRSALKSVRSNVLAIYSKQDPLVKVGSARYIFDHLTTLPEHRKMIILEGKNHVDLNDKLVEEITHFFLQD